METSSGCEPLQITEKPLKHLIGILHWQHKSGKPAHCLIRCYGADEEHVLVVLSALPAQGHCYQPLSDDVSSAATAAFAVLGEKFQISPERILWLCHYGIFSTYDTLWSVDIDSFEQVDLLWDGQQFQDKGDSFYYTLEEEEACSLIPLPLLPVFDVLKVLQFQEQTF